MTVSSLTSAQNTGGAGIDTLSGIENLTGSNSGDTLVGNSAANVLVGLDGADLLNGGGGADQMSGGLGNDVYVVNKAGDQVIEDNNPGDVDTVKASIDYTLGANVENLILIGATPSTAPATSSNNKLTGNAEDNMLSGLAGDDRLSGGEGRRQADRRRRTRRPHRRRGCRHVPLLGIADTGTGGSTRDRIADFAVGVDKIDLAAIDANIVGGGANDAFSFIGAAAFFAYGGPASGRGVRHQHAGDRRRRWRRRSRLSHPAIRHVCVSAGDFLL